MGSQLSLVCMWVHVNMCSHRNMHCCPSKPSEHESQTHWQNFGQRFRVVVFTIDINKRQLWKEIERYSVDYFGNMVMKPRKSISFQHNDVLGLSLHFVLEQMNWSNQTLHILIFIRCVDNFVSTCLHCKIPYRKEWTHKHITINIYVSIFYNRFNFSMAPY